MSKFTKALEKIQEERNEAKELAKAPSLKVPSSDDAGRERVSVWERIPVQKNIIPDNKLVMLRFPDSMISEQYRMLRTSLKSDLSKKNAKVVMVSSSIHSEGKTVTACNLAISLAENGDAKVALIDADVRRGNVGAYFGFGNNKPGLTDLLTGDLNPKQVMVRGALKNLFIIPRGKITKKSGELIGSSRFHLLVSELRTHFDYVIIDAPPIMSVADAGVLGREADGLLFIIQVGRTPKSVIAHSHVLFKQAGVPMLGYVLTNVEYQSADYRYYSYYYGEEPDRKDAIKSHARKHLKKAGWGFRSIEEKFNDWWDRKVLKKQAPEDILPAVETEEASAEK